MKLIAVLFTFVATVLASSSFNDAVNALKANDPLQSPLQIIDNLQLIQSQIHGVGVAGSSLLLQELVDSDLLTRIMQAYPVEVYEQVLNLNLFSTDDLLRPFKPIQASLSPSHPFFAHYKMLCKRMALSVTAGKESFSIDAVEVAMRLGTRRSYFREILFGLIHFRAFEYVDLVQLLGSDPYRELAHSEHFEVLLAAIQKFRIPPDSKVLSACREYIAPINPDLAAYFN